MASCVRSLKLMTFGIIVLVFVVLFKRQLFSTSLEYNTPTLDTALRFKARREHLQEVCTKLPQEPLRTTWKRTPCLIANQKSRLLVCAVHKSGSSSWHFIVWATRRAQQLQSTDSKHYSRSDALENFRIISKLSPSDGLKLIRPIEGDDDFFKDPPENSTYRVILARHPFARFISGWNQKFLLTSDYWKNLFDTYRVMKRYQKNKDETHSMTFGDFSTFIVDKYGDGKYFDLHFYPASLLCRPCEYGYNYIVKMESIDEDQQWLMNRLNLNHIGMVHRGHVSGGSVINSDIISNIKKYMSLLKPDVVRKLYKLYKDDFDFFGYTFNFSTLEAGGFE